MSQAWTQILLVLTLRCEKASEIRLRKSYGEATRTEKLAERLHRAVCGPCREFARQQAILDDAVHQYRDRDAG